MRKIVVEPQGRTESEIVKMLVASFSVRICTDLALEEEAAEEEEAGPPPPPLSDLNGVSTPLRLRTPFNI